MDKVFQEEQKKLAEIEATIDAVASRYEAEASKLQTEIAEYRVIDYDDLQNKQYLMSQRASSIASAEKFRSYQPSPYFGRLDMDSEESDESTTYYIGKEGISDRARVIVVDWRTPIGTCYYASNQKEFRVNGTTHFLALKRALDIKNGVLVSCRTDYDGETVSLEGDVIDPFLLTVLKDKRRHNRLTDIIRSIQGNQNEIIRKPRLESFVVQGCAGSGKTMVLLHRLSFLKFNNRNMSLNGVKIITPNKFFDAHINDLSTELGLTTIERYSVEEYYVSLIKRYSSKISADAVVQSEKLLSADMLSDIYSIQYSIDAEAHFHEYWQQILMEMDEVRLQQCFEKHKIIYPRTTAHTSNTASSLEQGLKQITLAISETEKKEKAVSSRLAAIDGEIKVVQDEYDRACANLEATKQQTIRRINVEIDSISETVKNSESQIEVISKHGADLLRQRKQLEAESEKYSSVLRMFSRGASVYSSYDSFIQQNDEASNFVRTRCSAIIASIVDAEGSYAKTPVYNFGKRNSLRKAILENKERFSIEVEQIVSAEIRDAQAKQESLKNDIKDLNSKITEINETIRSSEKENRTMRTRIAALQECGVLLASVEQRDVRTGLLPVAYKECAPFLMLYEEERSAANRFSHRLRSIIQTKKSLEQEQRELVICGYSSEEKLYVSECYKKVKKLQFSEISRNVMFRDLLAKYREYDQSYQKTNYRHKLYLKLLYCSLYFGRLPNPDVFLNIDEAQDISIAEYRLMRIVLGDRCVFNLYGDINQSVYSYKGIADWEEIADITSGNVYVLNENYRNTLQITNFCNKEFGAEVYPIGVSGEPVLETDTASAVKWLLNIKKMNPEARVAILHRHGLKAVQDNLRSMLTENDVSWYSVDDKKLSVLSVETAKGLEFEAVVAIVDQMSDNEKYISYTRALDSLTVVRDKYSSELDIDESLEGIDDEFIVAEGGIDEVLPDDSSINVMPEVSEHQLGKFFSWEIMNETTAVKTCDSSFFVHNESGVPKEICWFFDSGTIQPGESKTITLYFGDNAFEGKISISASKFNRMRISWNADLGSILYHHSDDEDVKVVFHKVNEDAYRVAVLVSQGDGNPSSEKANLIDNIAENGISTESCSFSVEEYAILAEFDAILEERFGSNYRLSTVQQRMAVELYRGNNVACNAPSGSMKSVILYLLALKEHQMSGKQTLLTAEAHLQENELVLADRLGLKGGAINTMDEFLADFKKEKYDVIFVPYEFFKQHENVGPFIEYFTDKITYWGIDHIASEQSIWMQLNNCGTALETVMFLMEKTGFSDFDLKNYRRIDIAGNAEENMVRKHTMFAAEEKLKWILENLDELTGQGLIYCDDETTCKVLGKQLRKAKIMAEAYIDVTNPDKKERINYLTNSFTCGGIPVLVTTHEAGKNLSNPNIRFVIHYDVPSNNELYQLHITQIGQLASNAVVHDLQIVR